MKPKTPEQLLIELEELRARLDEAEETLRAIRSGEVDALVVSGVGGEQVFTLKGAEQSYRMLIEDMNEGALMLSLDGVILYCNRRFAENIPPLLRESLGGAERIKQIVLDLKGFARLDEGKMNQTDLNHCIKSTANIVCNAIREVADIELQLNEIPLVVCNPQQINQVIANLLVNASQAMDKHGVITVTSRQEGEEVVLSIRDTGRGMTEEVRKRIFEPFFTTRDVGEGTGLGLSTAYGIIKQHDGEITVESEPGRGTTCTIRLPIKRNIAQRNNNLLEKPSGMTTILEKDATRIKVNHAI